MRVKDLYIKKMPTQTGFPKSHLLRYPGVHHLAESPFMTSPGMGCKRAFVDTLWHTSGNEVAVKSLMSLCLIGGYPSFGHDLTEMIASQ